VFSRDLKHCDDPSPDANSDPRPAIFGVVLPTFPCTWTFAAGEAPRSNAAFDSAETESTLDEFWELVNAVSCCESSMLRRFSRIGGDGAAFKREINVDPRDEILDHVPPDRHHKVNIDRNLAERTSYGAKDWRC
jgi:hypothetical protein